MFVGQSSFILEGRKVALAERRRHNDWLMWSYDSMFANYYESKFAWRPTLSLDWFSCYLNSSAQCRLPDFTASTRLFGKFKMADAADDARLIRFNKCQEEYPIEDVDRLAFLRIMTSARSLGCCRIKSCVKVPNKPTVSVDVISNTSTSELFCKPGSLGPML